MRSDLELVGAVTVAWVCLWSLGWVALWIERRHVRRRRERIRLVELELQTRSVCEACGAKCRVRFEEIDSDAVLAFRAAGRYVDRARRAR